MSSTGSKPSGDVKAPPPADPQRIAGFTILRKVYEGSVSTIYKARQDRLGRVVALKTIAEWPPPSGVALERFNRASYILAQVVHTNLPIMYESGTEDGYHYTALEYISGRTLQEVLAERGRLSERRAVWIGLHVARALSALHTRDIIHRNVKPKNILLDREGKVRLVGLGLAKCGAVCFTRHLEARTIGTPHYMAPEIIRGQEAEARSDLYSLGVSLYTMVTGRPPFDLAAPAAVMAKHLHEDPRPLRELRPDISDEFDQLVRELLEKNPERRPASAGEVAARLEALAARFPELGLVPAAVQPAAQAEPQPAPRMDERFGAPAGDGNGRQAPLLLAVLLLFALIFLLAAAALAYVVVHHFSTAREPPPAALSAVPANEQARAARPPDVKAPATAADVEQEYRRLLKIEEAGVFRDTPILGVNAWKEFLENFPKAQPKYLDEARARVKTFQRAVDEQKAREGSTPKPPAAQPRGGELDF